MHIHRNKGLFVFDFDDTLCLSEMGTAFVHHADGTTTALHGHLWSEYKEKPGDTFDFRDFEELKSPQPNDPVWNLYLARIAKHGNEHVWICTARGFPHPLESWLKKMGIENPQIACMSIPAGTNNGFYKARFVDEQVHKHGYGHVEFYDDRHDCCHSVHDLHKKHEDTRFHVYQVNKSALRVYKPTSGGLLPR